MTDSPNMMELIQPASSVALYERDCESIEITRTTSPSCSMRKSTESHLECLPPDIPVGCIFGPMEQYEEKEEQRITERRERENMKQNTDDLYDRVETFAISVKEDIEIMRETGGNEIPEKRDAQRKHLLEQEEVIEKTQTKSPTERNNSELEMDVKLKKALAKMKRLDNRLAEIVQKEKQVKQQRSELEKELHLDGHWETESIDTSTSDISIGTSCVFPTQPIERNINYYEEGDLRIECIETESHTTESENVAEEQDCENHKPIVQSDKRFITRNKELVGDVMTEKEKKRLEDLLVEEDDEEEERHIQIHNGFSYTDEDKERLQIIDSCLETLIPTLNIENNGISSNSTDDVSNKPGEEILVKLQISRGEHQRLKEIEERLETLKENEKIDKEDGDETSCISDVQLQLLLELCRKEQGNEETYQSRAQLL